MSKPTAATRGARGLYAPRDSEAARPGVRAGACGPRPALGRSFAREGQRLIDSAVYEYQILYTYQIYQSVKDAISSTEQSLKSLLQTDLLTVPSTLFRRRAYVDLLGPQVYLHRRPRRP